MSRMTNATARDRSKGYQGALALLSTLLLLAAAAAVWGESYPLVMLQGDSSVLHFHRMKRVATADPAIVDVAVTSLNELLVLAKSPGRTKVYVWDYEGRHDYAVVVKPALKAQEAQRQLTEIFGKQFTYTILDNRTLLMKGEVANQQRQDEVDKVAKDVAQELGIHLVIVYFRQDLAETAAQRQARVLREMLGNKLQYIAWDDRTVMVRGTVQNRAEYASLDALIKAGSTGGVQVANLVTIGSPTSPAPVGEITQALGPGFQVYPLEGRTVVVEGSVPDQAAKERADKLLAAFSDRADIVNLVQIQAKPGLPLSEKRKLLADALGSLLQVRTVGDQALVVEGTVPTEEALKDVQQVLDLFKADTTVLNLVKVVAPEKRQVLVKARVLDITRGSLDRHGFTFGQELLTSGEPGTRTPDAAALFRIQREVLPQLRAPLDVLVNALVTQNEAKVLAQPNLLVNDGDQARMIVGGEIPIPVPQVGGAATSITIEYKQFGVILEITPQVLPSGRIRLKIAVEVSDIDPSVSVAIAGLNVPGFRTRREETVVDVGSEETLAIGGLLQSTQSKAVEKFPVLGDLPVIGALFRNVESRPSNAELMILLMPQVLTDTQARTLGQEGLGQVRQAQPPLPATLYPNEK
jgi:Flp pilus assembly secretin CpaC